MSVELFMMCMLAICLIIFLLWMANRVLNGLLTRDFEPPITPDWPTPRVSVHLDQRANEQVCCGEYDTCQEKCVPRLVRKYPSLAYEPGPLRDELECGAPHVDTVRVRGEVRGDFGLTAEQRKRMEGFGNFG